MENKNHKRFAAIHRQNDGTEVGRDRLRWFLQNDGTLSTPTTDFRSLH